MKRLLLALALFLIPAAASAQCNGVFANGTVCGNSTGSANIPRAINPASLLGAAGGTNGQIQYNNTGALAGFTLSGDVGIVNSTGVSTVGKINGVPVNPVGAVANDTLAYNGTSYVHTAVFSLLNTICSAVPATCVSFFGYADPIWYGAGTGVANNAPAINAAYSASKYVQMTPGSYSVTAQVVVQPNTRLNCRGATIVQGNAANLGQIINFNAASANNAQIDHCILDGNSANNTINTSTNIVLISGQQFITISNCTLQNATGGNIVAGNSIYLNFENNYITNGISYGIAVFNTVIGSRAYATIRNNTILGPMLHLVQLDQVDGNIVSGNRLIQGTPLGNIGTSMQVTTNAGAITWVSGTNFAGVTLGNVLVANGGVEFPISAVNSSTSLTSSNTTNLTNVPASIGGGDVMSMTSTSYNRIVDNIISGGVTGGVVLSNQGGALAATGAAIGNIIANNNIENSGNFNIALEAPAAVGNPPVSQTDIIGNMMIGASRTGTAGTPGGAIQLYSVGALMPGVVIDGNFAYDPFAVAGAFWVTGSGAAGATNVYFGTNAQQGYVNAGNMSGYPTFASTPALKGYTGYIIDALAANCGDAACTTWNTNVTGGGGALVRQIFYDGTNFKLTSQ